MTKSKNNAERKWYFSVLSSNVKFSGDMMIDVTHCSSSTSLESHTEWSDLSPSACIPLKHRNDDFVNISARHSSRRCFRSGRHFWAVIFFYIWLCFKPESSLWGCKGQQIHYSNLNWVKFSVSFQKMFTSLHHRFSFYLNVQQLNLQMSTNNNRKQHHTENKAT